MKKIYIQTLIFLSILVSCNKNVINEEDTKVNSTAIPITVLTAEISSFYEYGEYYGRTQGVKRASIINILGGTVESVEVSEGAVVKKGDSLAKISHRSSEIALQSALLNEKISADNYLTLKKFLKSGNSTPKNVDQAQLAWLSSQTGLINAQKAYDASFCISPIDGVVVTRNINVEDEVMQGQNTFLIEDLSIIEINIGIPEGDMNGIKEGSKANVTLDLYPGRVWDGVLTRFSRRSSDKNLTFTATIIIDNKDGNILSGTTAKVQLLRNSYEDNVILPTDVVINENGQNFVMVYKNGMAYKRDVVVGVSNVERCVILNGIEPGEVLVQEGLHLLVDSQEVIVMNEGI
ncbi:MAG: efflux RND transporter periplasmic adaptor subunit [Spirochaetaceae bacterium]